MFQSISIHVFVEQIAGLFNIFSRMGFVCHLEDVFVVYWENWSTITYDYLVWSASLHPVRKSFGKLRPRSHLRGADEHA